LIDLIEDAPADMAERRDQWLMICSFPTRKFLGGKHCVRDTPLSVGLLLELAARGAVKARFSPRIASRARGFGRGASARRVLLSGEQT